MFYPRGKIPRYPLDRRLGGLQSRSGRGSEEKKSPVLPGIEPRSSTLNLITVLSDIRDVKLYFNPSTSCLPSSELHPEPTYRHIQLLDLVMSETEAEKKIFVEGATRGVSIT
jgi:hypothetical protein